MTRPALRDSDFPPLKNDLILRAARGETLERTPVWIMRQAGRYLPEFREARKRNDFFTICRTPELACEVTLQPIDRYGELLDASIIFSDILVVPQAMGMEVQMLEKQGPHFPEPLRTPDDLSKLTYPVKTAEALGYVMDAITLTRKELNGRVPLFGFVGAPWTLMAYMIEGGGSKTLSKAKTWLFKYQEASHKLLQMITDIIVDYLVEQAKAGAQLLQVFDSWAGELSPQEFNTYSLPYLKEIAIKVNKALKALNYDVPLVVFARGAHYALKDLAELEYAVISLDWTITPQQAREQTGGKVTLQGNADPSLLYADPAEIRSVVKKMLDGFGTEKRYIANLGHGMYPDHNPEHLKAYLEAIPHNVKVETAEEIEARRAKAEADQALARAMAQAAAARAEMEREKKKKRFHILQLGPMRFTGKKAAVSGADTLPRSIFGSDPSTPTSTSRPRTSGSGATSKGTLTRRGSFVPSRVSLLKNKARTTDSRQSLAGSHASEWNSNEKDNATTLLVRQKTSTAQLVDKAHGRSEGAENTKMHVNHVPGITLVHPKSPINRQNVPQVSKASAQNSSTSSSSSLQQSIAGYSAGYDDMNASQSIDTLSQKTTSIVSLRGMSGYHSANYRRGKGSDAESINLVGSSRSIESGNASLYPRSTLTRGAHHGSSSKLGAFPADTSRRRTPRGGRRFFKCDPDTPARKAQIAEVQRLLEAVAMVAEKKMLKDFSKAVKKEKVEHATFFPEEILKPTLHPSKWVMGPMLPVESSSAMKRQAALLALEDEPAENVGRRRRRTPSSASARKPKATLPSHKVAVLPVHLHREDSDNRLEGEPKTDSWWTREEYRLLKKGWDTRKKLIEEERRSREDAKQIAEEPFNAYATSRPGTDQTASKNTKHPPSRGNDAASKPETFVNWFKVSPPKREETGFPQASSSLFHDGGNPLERRPDTSHSLTRGASRAPSRAPSRAGEVSLAALTGVTAHPPPSKQGTPKTTNS
ncbi:hypothetical protein HDV05_008426 [Chytridiales sp. JEL 0842]|nr:hypothetical protein HDV05_008426 [Chytridiales sp. JEL 0842]